MKEKTKELIDSVLYKLRWTLRRVPILLLIVLINVSAFFLDQKIHQTAQHNKTLYEIVMATDAMSFMSNGGGYLGYNNYYKWCYVKWLRDPKRTWFQKIMFWDVFPDDPPDEYQYPFLGRD